MTWAMDDAPMLRTEKGKPDTTARHVLQALAEHAHPDGSNAHPSVLRIQYRTGYDRATVQRALRRLEKGGLIRRDGSMDGRNRWRLAMDQRRPASDWKELEREEEAERASAAERKRRSRAKRVTHAESVTVTDTEDVTVTHAESVTAQMSRTESAAVTHAECGRHARNAALTTNQPSDNQLPKDSSAPSVRDEDDPLAAFNAAAEARERQTEDLKAFGAFWMVYPKKRDREEALKEWRAAVARGADPTRIVAAATAYARERNGQEARFTKYPATWLRKGCYDDEPDPQPRRGVSGHIPFQNPENHDVYDEDLI